MITTTDLNTLTLSPTNKDYYQIWNELLEVSSKISERWDPTSTNESDPGIVLLKVLTALADKLNYNIDKNILEAFMPTAAQRESMQKLCDMMGYNIKYYQSATTDITISYVGAKEAADISVILPRFTVISDIDGTISYVTLEARNLTRNATSIKCMEGSAVLCTTDNNAVISIKQLDENNRYYLPENQIAENGIFIYSLVNGEESNTAWQAVQTLNEADFTGLTAQTSSLYSVQTGKKVYKFGYDSKVNKPYIQFPADISHIIGDGLHIYYLRTTGINGNIAAKALTTFTAPSDWKGEVTNEEGVAFTADEFFLTNYAAAVNGADPESLVNAYNGFKKTVGTFDTLVTCRDYMNYIYNGMLDSRPYVSNIVVSDIRDDINKAVTICTFNNYGINYIKKPQYQDDGQAYNAEIDHFDLLLYPFATIYNNRLKTEYINSFNYSTANLLEIQDLIANAKTISHNIKSASEGDIVCIKNYLRLNARITTVSKVNAAEESDILNNIKSAIYATFNMRNVDFGEELPFDSILGCIQNADARIKNVSLDDPDLITRITVLKDVNTDETEEYDLSILNELANNNAPATQAIAKKLAKLLLHNILAGKAELFNYDTAFSTDFTEAELPSDSVQTFLCEKLATDCCITKTSANIDWDNMKLKLAKNETVTFRAPSLITTITYPAYVYYFIKLASADSVIKAKSDYQLKLDEFLIISYTKTLEDETKVQKNVLYTSGNIICPNFDLYDSVTINSTTNAYVKDAQAARSMATDIIPTYLNQLEGFYAFGANEQLEIKEPVIVRLDKSPTYLYWILNDPAQELCNADNHWTYTLQDGEYLFYTDRNKLDLAYYGAGTEISTWNGESGLTLGAIDSSQIDIESIFEYGVSAVPWLQQSLGETGNGNIVRIQEYQYITLGESDTLSSIQFEASTDTLDNSKWRTVNTAKYIIASEDETTEQELSKIQVPETKWAVKSGLILQTNRQLRQSLRYFSASGYTIEDKVIVNKGPTEKTLVSGNGVTYGIKTNLPITMTVDSVEIKNAENRNLLLRVFKEYQDAEVTYVTSDHTVSSSRAFKELLHNFGDNWTSITGRDSEQKELSVINLSTNIINSEEAITTEARAHCYGLFVIYTNDAITLSSYADSTTSTEALSEFNVGTAPNTSTNTPAASINIKNQATCIKILPNCKILKIQPTAGEDIDYDKLTIIMGDVDIVNCNDCYLSSGAQYTDDACGINTKLFGYYDQNVRGLVNIPDAKQYSFNQALLDCLRELLISGYTTTATIGSDQTTGLPIINTAVTPQYEMFYYNCIINNDRALNINPTAGETLCTQNTWYDYNNVCNKFVISEIDADYLSDGIQIVKSSKLK